MPLISQTQEIVSERVLTDVNQIKRCNCKGGQCRQLYCVCLKQGLACVPGVCQCSGCQNDESEAAVKAREERKAMMGKEVRKGCNCKKNYCKKNYCICHNAGLHCDPDLCHCIECFNYDGAPSIPMRKDGEGQAEKPSEIRKRRKPEIQAVDGASTRTKGGQLIPVEVTSSSLM